MSAESKDPNARRAADFEESPQVKLQRLERTLADERKFSVKATTQLHQALAKDLRDAEKRADAAEKRAAKAERRAETAEARLAETLRSTTWKTGRAVVAVPAKIRRRMGRS